MSSVAFVLGTTAEAIKVERVIYELKKLNVATEVWSTEQQASEIGNTLEALAVGPAQVKLSSQKISIESFRDALSWSLRCLSGIWKIRKVGKNNLPDVLVVQGDTLSTVVGSLAGLALKIPVVHIEAGLRSGTWRSPFPEELNRRFVSRVAVLHLAPDESAEHNLLEASGKVVNTFGNTGIDALQFRFNQNSKEKEPKDVPNITVVLHRTELLSKKEIFAETMHLLGSLSNTFNITMTLDAPSSRAFQKFKHDFPDWKYRHLSVVPKLKFPEFVELLASTDVVITDSGGLQEECARLGIPCCVHREVSERSDGLNSNAVLTGMDVDRLRSKLANWGELRRKIRWPAVSPSYICASEIKKLITDGA